MAARNNERILNAARKVFLCNPEAPISAVAAEAAVGISALYLRYASKNELLRQLCFDGLERYIAETETALADSGDIWLAFSGFMQRIVEADTHALVLRLAGTFKPSKDLYRLTAKSQELTIKLFKRVKAAGAVRPDIEVTDLSLVFEQLAAVRIGAPRRSIQLRRRYLALILDSLRASPAEPLPGPAPAWQEINSRWEKA